MSKYRDLNRGDVLPASWTDAIQEQTSVLDSNLRLERATTTTVQIPAGTGSSQVVVGISGLWRWRTTSASAASPGGAAGVRDIYVVASANVFADLPDPDTDTTDYTFGLQVLASGTTPTGNYNARPITAYRKIGELDWDGTKITVIRQLVGKHRDVDPVFASAPQTDMAAAIFRRKAGQTVGIVQVQSETGAALATIDSGGGLWSAGAVTATGNVIGATVNATSGYQVGGTALASTHLSDTAALARLASPALTGNPTAPTPAANDNDTSVATTAYVQAELAAYATDTLTFTNKTMIDNMFFADNVDNSKKMAFQLSGITTGTTRTITVPNADGTLAFLASPTFTGTPTAPTAAANTNTTQLATTAYVQAELTAYASDTVTLTNKTLASPVVTGVISAPLGALTTPSYTFTGDLNTGMYSPGANQIAFVTSGGSRLNISDTAVTLSAALAHDGTTVGFYGVAPVARSAAYSPTNVTTDRAYNANATSLDELADVVGTLVTDLKATGIIG